MSTTYRRTGIGGTRTALSALVVGLTCALVAACGSGTPSSSKADAAADPVAVTKAAADLKASYDRPEFKVDGPSFDVAKAAGKNIWMISVDLSIPIEKVSADAAKTALGLAGAKLTVFDGKSDVTQFAGGIQTALGDHADVIILNSIDPTLVSGPVSQAAAAKIPIVTMLHGDADEPNSPGVVAQATYPFSRSGALLAAWIAADVGNQKGVGIQMITSDEVSQTAPYVKGFTQTVAKICPSCKVYRNNVPIADWQTKLTSQVNSTLNSHPDIKYVFPIYDGMITFAAPGVISSGRSDIKMVSFNATKSVMQLLAHKQMVYADLGSPQAWLGWAAADQALRVVTGNPPAKDENIGLRMFNASNIGSIDLAAAEGTWYGVDVEAGYKALWQLK